MVEQRFEEWRELKQKVESTFATPSFKAGADHRLVLRLLRNCHFTPWNKWFLWQQQDAPLYTLEHIFWDKLFDDERFTNPFAGLKYGWQTTPTMERKIFTSNSSVLTQHLAKLNQLASYESHRAVALDGDWITFDLPDSYAEITFLVSRHTQPIMEWAFQLNDLLFKLTEEAAIE